MAEHATIARPYVKALFSLAAKQDQVADWDKQLGSLSEIVRHPKMAQMLENPAFSPNEQKDLLLSAADSSLSPLLRNALEVFAQNKRLGLLPEVAKQFKTMALAQKSYKEAVIYSAYPMNEGQFGKTVSDLENHFNTKLQAKLIVDPELIGGLRIEMGDQILDLSVQGKLKKLYAAMTN